MKTERQGEMHEAEECSTRQEPKDKFPRSFDVLFWHKTLTTQTNLNAQVKYSNLSFMSVKVWCNQNQSHALYSNSNYQLSRVKYIDLTVLITKYVFIVHCVLSICMCILHIVFCTVCKYVLSICKFVFLFFCTVWSTLVRISLTKALVLW